MVKPTQEWEWKDVDEYKQAISLGGIQSEWVDEVERAKSQVINRIEKRIYPFDASWLNWRTDPNWPVPYLPENWDVVDY